VEFGLGIAAIFYFAKVADFSALSDLRASALGAYADGFGHESGFDAVFVSAFTKLLGELGRGSGVFGPFLAFFHWED